MIDMDIKTRHIGFGKNALIEITVTDWSGNSSIIEDVTDLKGKVDENLITALRQVADELEEHNLNNN